jgi:AcrR family transcriptional regulator
MAQQRKKNKPQLRTAETLAKILDAAQEIFSEQGFEKTQLEEVAARAGYSRGAIYAHYTSKEDVFLALMEQRVLTKYTAMRQALETEPIVSRRLPIFKRWLGTQVSDQSWSTLMLEFKLYALRRPESRDKLLKLYEQMASSSIHDFIKLLFGDGLSKAARLGIERRLSIMGSVLSAVALESHFKPHLFPRLQIQAVLEEAFEALVHA